MLHSKRVRYLVSNDACINVDKSNALCVISNTSLEIIFELARKYVLHKLKIDRTRLHSTMSVMPFTTIRVSIFGVILSNAYERDLSKKKNN